jgi:hypothetical protein
MAGTSIEIAGGRFSMVRGHDKVLDRPFVVLDDSNAALVAFNIGYGRSTAEFLSPDRARFEIKTIPTRVFVAVRD